MTDEPMAWIDHRTLRVPRGHFVETVLRRMAPDVQARVQNILREARHDQIMFALGDGPYNVTERDLEGLNVALDTSGALWRSRPEPRGPVPLAGEHPAPGEWPCQHAPVPSLPPRLLAFLYVLIRDGAAAPGDVEQHAINAGRSPRGTEFTNPHIENYAHSLGSFLLDSDA